jgi:hypothetical protein
MKLSQLTTRKFSAKRNKTGRYTRHTVVLITGAFIAHGKLYRAKKHSTRSKYRGYYIVQLKGSIANKEIKVAKNLTKSQAVAWVQLLRS